MIDSNYTAGAESVSNAGNVYTITYTISGDPANTTPDGSYDLPVYAEDVAGNQSALSTSIELDNTAEAVTILQPGDGDLLTGDVTIDVTSADDTRFVRFQVSPDGGATWYNLDGTQTPNDYTQDDDATDGWTQIWRTADDALPDGVDYQIRVLAYDEQNPTAHLIGQDVVGGGLVVDNTPPSLTIEVFSRCPLKRHSRVTYTAKRSFCVGATSTCRTAPASSSCASNIATRTATTSTTVRSRFRPKTAPSADACAWCPG